LPLFPFKSGKSDKLGEFEDGLEATGEKAKGHGKLMEITSFRGNE